MSVPLPTTAKRLADAPTYVTVATIRADGSPRQTVMWVSRDGDELLLSTAVGRAKERDLRRDPRIGVVLIDPSNPYDYAEVRGTAVVTETGGQALIDQLALKYTGDIYKWDPPEEIRVVIRVRADQVLPAEP